MKTIAVGIGMFLSVLSVEISSARETVGYDSQGDSTRCFDSLHTYHSNRKHSFALKSNLLYWAAAIPNISVEFYLSSRLSLHTEVNFAWWANRSASFYWQILTVTPELRYWLSQDSPFKGHSVGIYTGGGIYDVMFNTLTGDKGYQGKFYTLAGISYGYVFPISRRLSMELGLGVGYVVTKYYEYVRGCSDFMRTDTKRTTWIGPTKINILLVWQLPR